VLVDVREWPAVWLRDNCSCRECRDPGSGQKLFQITDLPADLVVAGVKEGPESVTVVFGPDGHRGQVGRELLEGSADSDVAGGAGGRTEDGKRLWDGPIDLTEAGWDRYQAEPVERARVLGAVLRDGFALLRGVPAEDGMVAAVAGSFGYVRETNYGAVFDVRVEATPANLASTGLGLSPHTDNPYRDPVPTVQLLHCHVSAADGGDTVLVDGFAAAAALRLAAGDCLIFDNTRILHGRTGFTSTGNRRLQGCYADLDGLASTVALIGPHASQTSEEVGR
jgi:gamma-butyrobetaine dioxygenase